MISKIKSLLLKTIIPTLCLAVTYLSFTTVHNIEKDKSEQSFADLTDHGLATVDQQVDNFRRTLDGVAGLIIASDNVTAEELNIYIEVLKDENDLSGVHAIGFAESSSFINSSAGDIFEPYRSGQKIASRHQPSEDERFIVKYVELLETSDITVGFDFSSDPNLLDVARTSHDTHATLLAIAPQTSASEKWPHRGVILKPIYNYEATQMVKKNDVQRLHFVGFSFMIIDVGHAFNGLSAKQKNLFTVTIEDEVPYQAALPNAQNIGFITASPVSKYTRSDKFRAFGNTLTLTWRSTLRFDAIQPFRVKWIVLGLGLLITALITAISHILIKRNNKIKLIFNQKSKDLDARDKEQRSILENVMLGIISVSPCGKILHSNEAAESLLSRKERIVKLTGMSLGDLLPTLDLKIADGRFKITTPDTHISDKCYTLEIEKKTWETPDKETRFTLLLKDITASENHVQELARTEQRWNLALKGAGIGVFDIDLEQQTSVVSKMWWDIIQIDNLTGCVDPYRLQTKFIHPDDIYDRNEADEECIAGNIERAESRFRIKRSDGAWRWIQSDAVVVERAANGTALRMLGTQRDITENIEINQIKRDFVATVSHELRTPLTSIKGALELLKSQFFNADSSTMKRLINIASSNSDRLAIIVNDILDMEKIGVDGISKKLKAESLFDIMHLASEQVETYALKWRVGIEVLKPEHNQYIWTDESRIIQVLTNLLSNACKFSFPDTNVRLIAEIQSNCVKISVLNFGPGIPYAFRGQVFQPFAQADSSDTRLRGGTGLGLSISSQLVKAMGGTIGFTSVPGEETVFWFTCRLADHPENMPELYFEEPQQDFFRSLEKVK
jgi:signal transduction histidine kinase/CHASE1-domain containing sensor protein